MKKFGFALAFLATFSLNCFNWPWASELPVVTPKVLNIYVYDPIQFESLEKKIFEATNRQDVVGIILVINSGGGSTGNFSVVHDMVKKLSSTKPVVALIAGSALSCGYLVASAANKILAHSVSEIGNIGVYYSVDRYKNARISRDDIEADVSVDVIAAGEFKAMDNPYAKELSDSQRVYLKVLVSKLYDSFLTLVAQNRRLKKEDYAVWAEGKIFLPAEALEHGLIDGLGTIFDAQEKIKELILERNPQANFIKAIEFVS